MLGAGTIINPITKVITTVAILAAVYFFILKPALESTERISSSVTESSRTSSATSSSRSRIRSTSRTRLPATR